MQAVVQYRYGDTDRLQLAEIDIPVPGPNDVLVRVRAAGVDRGTWHLMTGLPLAMRLGFGLRGPRQRVIGRDLAGVVEAVGSEVTAVRVGDEVIGTANGSFAEFALVPEKRIARRPRTVSFEESAVLPISGGTALQAVRDSGRVQSGQQVLVIGASGGVGSFAVQLAALAGAEVIGVASASKAQLVRDLGAVEVLDYANQSIAADDRRYDVILDFAGNRSLGELRAALTQQGTLVVGGGEGGTRLLGGMSRPLRAGLLSPFVRQRLTALISTEKGADFADLAASVDDGVLHPRLERTYPLHEAAKAIDHLAAGHVRGKVAITI